MTREEIKRRAELYSALAEGKIIQFKQENGEWTDLKIDLMCGIAKSYKYRIKPEPKYRPFKSQEECWEEMHKHPDFGWIKDDDVYRPIIKIDKEKIYYLEYGFERTGIIYSSFKESLELKFTDDEPFGVKKE